MYSEHKRGQIKQNIDAKDKHPDGMMTTEQPECYTTKKSAALNTGNTEPTTPCSDMT
jgi:hypothetical protein